MVQSEGFTPNPGHFWVEINSPFTETSQTYAIGNSMGGFLAIVMSRFLPIETVIAFAPQFSVDPNVVPWEDRWKVYRDAIEAYHIRDAGSYFVSGTTYFLLSGGRGADLQQARLYPVQSNVNHFLFPELHHKVAAALKAAGKLNMVVQQAFDGQIDAGAWGDFRNERLSP